MVVVLNYNVFLFMDKIFDFLRKFYKFKLCYFFFVVFVMESEIVELSIIVIEI